MIVRRSADSDVLTKGKSRELALGNVHMGLQGLVFVLLIKFP